MSRILCLLMKGANSELCGILEENIWAVVQSSADKQDRYTILGKGSCLPSMVLRLEALLKDHSVYVLFINDQEL